VVEVCLNTCNKTSNVIDTCARGERDRSGWVCTHVERDQLATEVRQDWVVTTSATGWRCRLPLVTANLEPQAGAQWIVGCLNTASLDLLVVFVFVGGGYHNSDIAVETDQSLRCVVSNLRARETNVRQDAIVAGVLDNNRAAWHGVANEQTALAGELEQ